MPDETEQTAKRLRPSIDDVVEAARRGTVLDWSDNPALYSASLEQLYPELAEQPGPRRQKSIRRKKVAS
jgi:hypothetical protein